MKVITERKGLPIQFEIKRLDYDEMEQFQTDSKELRNKWCQTGKVCPKYNQRPCCPPNVPLFSELKRRKYIYLVSVTVCKEDYLVYSPKTMGHKSEQFLYMGTSHKTTRNLNNSLVSYFKGQAFRVGGCLGCSYTKTNTCKRFAPPLEGTGIDVCMLAAHVFNTTITWGKDIKSMVAIGGIYTNEVISKSKFEEVINHVCNK